MSKLWEATEKFWGMTTQANAKTKHPEQFDDLLIVEQLDDLLFAEQLDDSPLAEQLDDLS